MGLRLKSKKKDDVKLVPHHSRFIMLARAECLCQIRSEIGVATTLIVCVAMYLHTAM